MPGKLETMPTFIPVAVFDPQDAVVLAGNSAGTKATTTNKPTCSPAEAATKGVSRSLAAGAKALFSLQRFRNNHHVGDPRLS